MTPRSRVDRERDLGRDLPSGDRLEHGERHLVERGVPRVDQPLQLAAAPGRVEVEPDLEHLGDAARAPGYRADLAALDQRDGGDGDPRDLATSTWRSPSRRRTARNLVPIRTSDTPGD